MPSKITFALFGLGRMVGAGAADDDGDDNDDDDKVSVVGEKDNEDDLVVVVIWFDDDDDDDDDDDMMMMVVVVVLMVVEVVVLVVLMIMVVVVIRSGDIFFQGVTHLKHIMTSPRATVKWIVRNQIQEAERFVKDFNLSAKCATPENLEPVFNDPEVNAVLICSPTGTHAEIIKASLIADKAVFCEKPVTPDIPSTAACYDLASSKQKPLLCAFHRRFDPSFKQLYQRVRNQDLGNVKVLKSISREVKTPSISYVKISGIVGHDKVS
ncbi:hypothetical protein KUTeg_012316 [Tegillarca granosa]|uniref:Gfo/Idh/MocA-like oxidoreductase N-terminal domain-containing protein n=1 Tax=Tegillarca granosa TaxID=220873 RepID=A0ABQ9F2M8_TEGGR|nr:hypothetical protein KUTeg_012316 [Tegillarca granosa]